MTDYHSLPSSLDLSKQIAAVSLGPHTQVFDDETWDVSLLALRKFPRYIPESRGKPILSNLSSPVQTPPRTPQYSLAPLETKRFAIFNSISEFSLDESQSSIKSDFPNSNIISPSVTKTPDSENNKLEEYEISVEDIYSMMMPDYNERQINNFSSGYSNNRKSDELNSIDGDQIEEVSPTYSINPSKLEDEPRLLLTNEGGRDVQTRCESCNDLDFSSKIQPSPQLDGSRTYIIGMSPNMARQNNIVNRVLTESQENTSESKDPHSFNGVELLHFPGSIQRDHSVQITTNSKPHRSDSLIMKLFHHIHEKSHGRVFEDHIESSSVSTPGESIAFSETGQTIESHSNPNSPRQESCSFDHNNIGTTERHHKDHFSFLKRRQNVNSLENDVFSLDSPSEHNLFKDLMSTGRRKRSTSVSQKEKPLESTEESSLSQSFSTGQGQLSTIFSSSIKRSSSELSMSEKYGKVDSILGKGAHAIVKLAHKSERTGDEKVCAVKEFRKRKKDESHKDYLKKVVAEFCISSTLHHPNVVETIDLIQDEHHKWCVIMEYAPGGDLYARINRGTLCDFDEICCYFKQILHGVAYMHSIGVAHRDLKPENLLLDSQNQIVKITDFGVAEVFRTLWESKPRRCKGVCGSEPYISPEEWNDANEYDPTKADVWACGIIFYTMCFNSVPWKVARSNDQNYQKYLCRQQQGVVANYAPFNRIENPAARSVILKMLDPDPEIRPSIASVLETPWIQSTEACTLLITPLEEGGPFNGKIQAPSKHNHPKKNEEI
ncbi:serine/threonine-protein kinase HAL4/sat4 [Nowakowskiella sp. JEL0078]|nr:serine/threonine-protein kinase HAL4/sat4 [Nowakowskiella sp. JEL0078]